VSFILSNPCRGLRFLTSEVPLQDERVAGVREAGISPAINPLLGPQSIYS